MDEQTKETLVELQKEKAIRFLSQADDMMRQTYWNLAANRFCYACFHAVQALFMARGISAHTHSGTISQFSIHFVKPHIVDVSCGSFLARLFQLRQKADYNCAYDIEEDEVREVQTLSHKFIQNVMELIIE